MTEPQRRRDLSLLFAATGALAATVFGFVVDASEKAPQWLMIGTAAMAAGGAAFVLKCEGTAGQRAWAGVQIAMLAHLIHALILMIAATVVGYGSALDNLTIGWISLAFATVVVAGVVTIPTAAAVAALTTVLERR